MNDDEFDSYYLQGSQIKIAVPTEASKPYEVASNPVEATGCKLALQHDDYFWISTSVKISKTANTDLVSSIGTDVTDNRVVLIETAGAIAKTAMTLTAAGSDASGKPEITALNKKTDFPYLIDTVGLLAKSDSRGAFQLTTSHATIDVGPLPPDAVALTSLTFPLSSHAFLYAACRSAVVRATVKDGDNTIKVESTVKIADPNYVQRVHLLKKGTIAAQTQCGVSVTPEGADTSDSVANLQVIKALVGQISNDMPKK